MQRDRHVVAIAENVADAVEPEGALTALHELADEPEDCVAAIVGAGKIARARLMPDERFTQQFGKFRQIPVGDGIEVVTYDPDILIAHETGPLLLSCRKPRCAMVPIKVPATRKTALIGAIGTSR